MSGLPQWWDKDKQRQNTRSRKQEREYAKEKNGKTRAGSGSSWRKPQDCQEENSLTQLKGTNRDSFTININEWKRIHADALRDGREGKLVIDFYVHGVRLVITEETRPRDGS